MKTNAFQLNKLTNMGAHYVIDNDVITISKAKMLKPINITTLVYPGFPTDLGQPMSVVLTQAEGVSYFEETIWENRFRYVEEMRKFGADITRIDNTAKINGKKELHGADVIAPDLRAGAALVILALAINGESTISNISNIERGYENFVSKLKSLGADIRRV